MNESPFARLVENGRGLRSIKYEDQRTKTSGGQLSPTFEMILVGSGRRFPKPDTGTALEPKTANAPIVQIVVRDC